jgi:hypothetical protein
LIEFNWTKDARFGSFVRRAQQLLTSPLQIFTFAPHPSSMMVQRGIECAIAFLQISFALNEFPPDVEQFGAQAADTRRIAICCSGSDRYDFDITKR